MSYAETKVGNTSYSLQTQPDGRFLKFQRHNTDGTQTTFIPVKLLAEFAQKQLVWKAFQ